jgi:hypothetical protein
LKRYVGYALKPETADLDEVDVSESSLEETENNFAEADEIQT